MKMLIIAGHLEVAPDSRDAYNAAFADLVSRAREAPGCLDVAITADPGIPIRTADVQAYEISSSRTPFD